VRRRDEGKEHAYARSWLRNGLADIDRIKTLFGKALDITDADACQAWLIEQCGADSATIEEVQSLLRASHEAETRRSPDQRDEAQIPARQFGPYVAVKLLERGGTSAVYFAERRDGEFQQTVALKVMAPFLSGPEFLRRFETERQLLAALNHPRIAHLLDGGTSSEGDSWLAMEYVDGERLDQYCDHHGLVLETRLRLFMQICEAVEYAHRRLIVHRDLKPGNILVTPEGSVKLLDFGTGALLASRNDATMTRTRMLTPRYASPARLRGEAASVGDDVFSLGVILYELLTGAWPFGDPKSASDALKRLDGTATATPLLAAAVANSFRMGSLSNDRLRGLLQGDLSLIVSKALEPGVDRGYATVAELAADVKAYFESRPIQARKNDLAYRVRKMVRRHKVAIAAALLVTILLIAAIGGILWQSRVAREQRVRAEARAEDLRKLSNTLLSDLDEAIQKLPGSTEAQRLLVTAVTDHLNRMQRDVSGDPRNEIDMANGYIRLGNVEGNPYDQNMGDPAEALASIGKAIAIAEPLVRSQPGNVDAARALAWAYQSGAEVLFGQTELAKSAAEMRKAVGIFDTLANLPGSGAPELVDSATAWGSLGDILGQPGVASLSDIPGAQAAFEHVMAIDKRILRLDPSNARARRGMPLLLSKMANLVNETDPPRALDGYRSALAAKQALPPEIRDTLPAQRFMQNDQNHIGMLLVELGKYDEALVQFEEVRVKAAKLVAEDPKDSRAVGDLLNVLEDEADCFAARELGVFSPDPHPKEDAAAALECLVETIRINRKTTTDAAHRASFAGALVQSGIQKRILHRTDGLAESEEGIRLLEKISLDPLATTIELDHAVEGLVNAKPDSLRRPGLAVKAAERMIELTHRTRPAHFLQLALAYRGAGQPDKAREVAREGLALLAAVNGPPFRVRILLEKETHAK
jgi:eukaryotic-like serine/threonine-protein kinase